MAKDEYYFDDVDSLYKNFQNNIYIENKLNLRKKKKKKIKINLNLFLKKIKVIIDSYSFKLIFIKFL